jgi:hypothetical protein|tara:strand:+ start:2926 stop:3159 length:234 start_codon:yes stop_codon:yes gene_type:complete
MLGKFKNLHCAGSRDEASHVTLETTPNFKTLRRSISPPVKMNFILLIQCGIRSRPLQIEFPDLATSDHLPLPSESVF